MPVTIAPDAEACQALVDRINAGSGVTYTLPSAAFYSYEQSEDLNKVTDLEVEILCERSGTLQETLDIEDRTSHEILVSVRKKVANAKPATIDPLKLIVRQIFQRVNGYATSRIRVWDCDLEDDGPNQEILRQAGVFSASFPLRIEVEASP